MRHTFSKSERLKSEKSISLLFQEGLSAYTYPINLVFRKYECQRVGNKTQVLSTVSVSKKKFKKAVDRNRIKRQLRELYRLNKDSFYSLAEDDCLDCMLIYTSTQMEEYSKMQMALKRIFNKLLSQDRKTSG